MNRLHKIRVLTSVGLLMLSGCATFQPPNPNGPRADARPYPITLSSEPSRINQSLAAWRRLLQQSGSPSSDGPNLDQVTGTILSLPQSSRGVLFLPKIQEGKTPSEEELRESLRRFILRWPELIGTDPTQLSLVERSDQPDGTKLARYEQRPFRYPLRGNYGQLLIRFNSDLKVLDISSRCLPNTNRFQSALANLTTSELTPDDVLGKLRGTSITLPYNSGRQQPLTLNPDLSLQPTQLVVYAIRAQDPGNDIDLHLAWEIGVSNGPIKTLYVDAISGQVLGGT